MTATRLGFVCTVAALLASADLFAQEPREIAPGQRIRVLAPALSTTSLTGEVLEADELGFVFHTETGRELSVGLRQVDSLWVWNGTRGSHRRGALLGAGVGLLAGIVIGARSDCGWLFADNCGAGRALSASVWGIFVGGAGAMIGAGLGEFVRRDDWLEMQTRTRPPGRRLQTRSRSRQ